MFAYERGGGGGEGWVWKLPHSPSPILVWAWHTHHHPYTVVNVSKVVPNNTPNAQIVVQLQTKFVKQCEQGLPLTSSSGLLIFSSGRP